MDWKLTATKLYCEAVNQWVTILVYSEGEAKCNYRERKMTAARNEELRLCLGYEKCPVVAAYKEDVFQREEQENNV